MDPFLHNLSTHSRKHLGLLVKLEIVQIVLILFIIGWLVYRR